LDVAVNFAGPTTYISADAACKEQLDAFEGKQLAD
jgi:hypothetical protein